MSETQRAHDRWVRLAVYAILAGIAPTVLGFAHGLLFVHVWEWYGDTIPEAMSSAQFAQRVAIRLLLLVLCWLFLRRVAPPRWVDAILLWLAVQLLATSLDMMLTVGRYEFSAGAFGRITVVMLVAWAIVVLVERWRGVPFERRNES